VLSLLNKLSSNDAYKTRDNLRWQAAATAYCTGNGQAVAATNTLHWQAVQQQTPCTGRQCSNKYCNQE